jgi:hypothetical protein
MQPNLVSIELLKNEIRHYEALQSFKTSRAMQHSSWGAIPRAMQLCRSYDFGGKPLALRQPIVPKATLWVLSL